MSSRCVTRFGRIALSAALGAWVSVALVGCSRKSIPSAASMGMGGAETGCLNRAGEASRRYFQGTASEAEASDVWDCAIRSLTLFSERTRGEQAGLYTPGELRAFLEKYFLTDIKITDSFLREAMEMKRVLIGGRVDSFTAEELEKTKAIFGAVKNEALRLHRFMPLTLESLARRAPREVDEASAALLEAARSLGAILQNTNIPYPFTRMNELLRELEAFHVSAAGAPGAPSGDEARKTADSFRKLRENLPKLRAIKRTFIGNDSGVIAGNEWSITLETGARWYGLLLRYENLKIRQDIPSVPGLELLGNSWLVGQRRELLLPIAQEGIALLDEAIARHSRQQITYEEINDLLDALFPQGSFEMTEGRPVTLPHFKPFVEKMIRRMMAGVVQGPMGRAANGLTQPAVARTWRSLKHWAEGQRYLEAAYAAATRSSPGSALLGQGFTVEEFLPHSPESLMTLGYLAAKTPPSGVGGDLEFSAPALADASSRLLQMIRNDRPLFVLNGTRIYFDGYRAPRRHSLLNLTQMHWMYELSRLLTRGYAEDISRAQSRDDRENWITQDEFTRFCDDIHDVAGDMKLIDLTDDKLPEKRFRESALFTFGGDGDARFSTAEAAQLLALMFSAKDDSVQIHSQIQAVGCPSLGPDQYGSVKLDTRCYRTKFFENRALFWRQMPHLLRYYDRLSGSERAGFERSVEQAARKVGYSDHEPIHSGDSEGFAMAAHYLEVTFSRFDRDESNTLDRSEAETAFSVFKRSLAEISCDTGHCLTSDADLLAVFTYMLAKGESPTPAQFVIWRYLPFFQSFQSDRGMVMRIFAKLATPSARPN